MQLKSLPTLVLALTLALVHFATSSYDDGINMNGTSCGGCHGNTPSTLVMVTLSGLPTTYVTNQTYTLTFTCSAPNTALMHSGYNVKCSGGKFNFNPGTGSKFKVLTDSTQITHGAVSSTNTWTFTWKAPSTSGPVTFNYVGNMVNNDGNDSNVDKWNTGAITITGLISVGISSIEKKTINCYPNPVTNLLTIAGKNLPQTVQIRNVFGQILEQISVKNNTLDVSKLTAGSYILSYNFNGTLYSSSFIKQ